MNFATFVQEQQCDMIKNTPKIFGIPPSLPLPKSMLMTFRIDYLPNYFLNLKQKLISFALLDNCMLIEF